jgi:GntR family transcriptional regulator/MocR family aminotransferase
MELILSFGVASEMPLYQRIYSGIREAVLTGRLRAGERLPSTRELADRHTIGRNTVNLAYDRLVSEGFLESRRGSGTYVAASVSAFDARKNNSRVEPVVLPGRFKNVQRWVYAPPSLGFPYDFRPGMPSLDHFPLALWRRIVARQLRHLPPDLARYEGAAGYRPLREQISAYLQRSRAVSCDADQVVVTSGSQQALDLLARLLVLPRQEVIVENPCYAAAVAAFRAAGAKLRPVSVDDHGLRTDDLPPNVRLLYVTPSHQYPTGVCLSVPRRLQLLSWARKNKSLIVEDDYDCEYRYGSRPVESLQGLDQSGLVAYVGTFSKVLFPTLRLGYAVLPPSLVQPFTALKWITDRHTTGLDQRFMADFMSQGYFERYLRKMRKVYGERRRALTQSLAEHAGRHISVAPSVAGLHMAGWLDRNIDLSRLKALAAEAGVGIYPLTPYFLTKARPGLLFGYSAIPPDDIRKGIRRLGRILDGMSR